MGLQNRRPLTIVLGAIFVVGTLTIFLLVQIRPWSSPSTTSQVSSAFTAHLQKIASRNVSAVMTDYENNATVVFEGDTAGLSCNCTSLARIRYLFQSAFTGLLNLSVTENGPTYRLTGNKDVVNSTLLLSGYSTTIGRFNGTLSAEAVYDHASVGWLISSETWNFRVFKCNPWSCRT